MIFKTIKPWIISFRLRTLPLAASCVILGSLLAAYYSKADSLIFILALATTLFLQILSNISNEYGDMVKGTDTDERVGPERSIQRGDISISEMKIMIIAMVIITAFSGLSLVIYATDSYYTILFIIAGGAAITAAIKYTVGRKPYGYMALGDLFVFIFFGPVGVAGTFFLHTGSFRTDLILPSITTGLLSVAVLNLNNMRDVDNDLKHGKITLASILGRKYSRIYHSLLILVSVAASIVFAWMNFLSSVKFIYAIVFIPLADDLRVVFITRNPAGFDPELKKVAAANLLHSLLLGIALIA